MRSDSWQLEKDFVPATLKEAAELSRAIRAHGHGKSTASSIVGWLIEKRFGSDPLDSATRARYRKVLASLNGDYPHRPRRKGEQSPLIAICPGLELPAAA